jgi:formylglycine-generating enzyme
VWEWVWDWYGSYGTKAVSDPTGPNTGSYRVIHGGGWYHDAQCLRSACRDDMDSPGYRNLNIGFRVVRLAL